MTDSKYSVIGDSPQMNILVICMRRGENVEKKLNSMFGMFDRVVIDVEGEQHEFSADSLIRLLEGLEGARDDR